ncbi:hypothetical protein ACHQM5_025631 [Ranunculus cassubicifolius]
MAKSYYSELQNVMLILKKTFKLLERNKKIFLSIVLATMIPLYLFLLANKFILASLFNNLSLVAVSLFTMTPATPDYARQIFKIQEDTILVFLVEMIYLVIAAMVSLSSMVSTIYVSGMSYIGKDLTLKELWSKIKQIWVRPLITWFYTSLMITGVSLVILLPCIFVAFARGSIVMLAVGIIPIVLVSIVNIYLGLIWLVGLVSSVLEDCSGLEALGKAEKLVSKKKIVGFVLMIVLVVPFSAIYLLTVMSSGRPTGIVQFSMMDIAVTLGILLNIVSIMTCTVFYFDCKHSHGEQVELEEEMGYTKVSTIPLNV